MSNFPKNFLWGAATSAHQVEGGNHNDWSEWELKNAKRLTREAESRFGRFPSWPEIGEQAAKSENYISGIACDHYHRFREDFDIAKELGHNAHRFSIEWSRIEPEEGKFNEKEIEHYREVIQALRERGMEPFVTLWHWTVPVWFQAKGGWLQPRAGRYFGRFVERMAEEFGSQVKFWCTLNEPMVFLSYGYGVGIRPPQHRSVWQTIKVFHRLAAGHRRAYRILHQAAELNKWKCAVGIAKHNKWFVAADRTLKNRFIAAVIRFLWNDAFMLYIRMCQDYAGLNYYNKNVINFGWSRPRKGVYNPETSAEGLYQSIKDLTRYGKPIYILENGVDDPKDSIRPQFIKDHIAAMRKAMQEGADVCGYFHWSLVDNFEWESGFWPRFGLVEVDRKTLERHIRPSAWEYKKIIDANQ